ncbi:rhodanese-like domain-containing protein [Novipirellula sp. SH528]|uniref:rhodanese-like domain-containing protein n=1 Tax=Novipirellula sp. SH528 TaxID=3454466 RepID=UPI003FA13235
MSIGNLIIRLCDSGFGTIEATRRFLRRPEVRTISTSDLRSALKSDNTPPVLVDVRSDAEQSVSRIPGAITQQEYEAEADAFAGRQVAVYCTVGGRSYLYARKLVTAGVNATNYRDGILGWCRDGLPLESPDKQPTTAVHPYWRIFHVPDQYEVKT